MDDLQKRTEKLYDVVANCLSHTAYLIRDLEDYSFLVRHVHEDNHGVLVGPAGIEVCKATGENPSDWDVLLRIENEGARTRVVAHSISSFIRANY